MCIQKFSGVNPLVCSFRVDVIETFTPIWPHVDQNENKLENIQNLKFHNPSSMNFGRDSHWAHV